MPSMRIRPRTFMLNALRIIAILVVLKYVLAFGFWLLRPDVPDIPGRKTAYPKQLLIEVNIPERALYLYQIYAERQFLIKKYPCTIGSVKYKTPEGNFLSSELIWNPGWLPPSSYWAKDLEPAEPGKGPLGGGSLVVDYDEALLIHGTSEEADIGRPASHGCVRLRERDITELLSYIQNNIPNSQGTANITEYKKHTHASVRVDMRNPVAVHFVYRRAEPNGQRIVMYPDIYKEGDLMNEERLVTATQLVGRSGNLERTIHDLQPTMSAKSQQVLIPMVQGRKIEPQALEKYYLPAKLRFFVWYINDRGTVTAWSRLFSKTERAQ